MAKLFTEVEDVKFKHLIDYHTSLFFIGSCFSASIGERFSSSFFITTINPFGTLYNPVSIASTLKLLQAKQRVDSSSLFCDGEMWGNLDFSTLFSSHNPSQALQAMNSAVEQGANGLENSNVIFITLGSSWVYRHKESGKIVASCHKLPAREFSRELLTHTESVEHLASIFAQPFYADKQIILTVSPVRHQKDGFVQNTISKSHLILAANELCSTFDNVSYLPIYEIFMDELRDYRFYNSDLIHPSPFAVDIVWERVQRWFFSDETQKFKRDIEQIVADKAHRPKYPESESYALFKQRLQTKIESVEAQLGRRLVFNG